MFCLLIFGSTTSLTADVRGTNGTIPFIVNNQQEMILTSTGLGLGRNLTPAANLHLAGNALVSSSLSVGGNLWGSNLNITGTIGVSTQTFSSTSGNLAEHSLCFVDTTSAGNTVRLGVPSATTHSGRIYMVKCLNTTFPVILIPTEGSLIDDRAFVKLVSSDNTTLPTISIIASSGNWFIHSELNSNPWKVTSLSNVSLWLDSWDRSHLQISNGNVIQWNDLSGRAHHAVQNNASYQPRWTGSEISFDPVPGVAKGFTVDAYTDFQNQEFCVVSVTRWDTSYTWGNIVMSYCANGINGWMFRQNGVNVDWISLYYYNPTINWAIGTPTNQSSLCIVSALRSKSTGDTIVRHNGTQKGQGNHTGAIDYSVARVGIGMGYVNTTTVANSDRPLSGTIKELIYLDNYSASSVEKIEGYLAHKWGLQGSLPSSHPYRYAPP